MAQKKQKQNVTEHRSFNQVNVSSTDSLQARITVQQTQQVRPLQVSQLGQLSLLSFRGRQMSSRPV